MDSKKLYQLYYKDSNPVQPIRGFCATVENNCIVRKAGETLGIEPATISKQIKSLEKKLGITLFKSKNDSERRYGKISLTEEGEIFYQKAKPIITSLDKLFLEYSKELDSINNNKMSIATTTFVAHRMLRFVNSFEKSIPDNKKLDISVFSASQEEGIKAVLNNKADLFFSHRERNIKLPYNVEFVKITEYIPYLVLYKGHPLENVKSKDITVQDLVNTDLGFNYEEITMSTLKGMVDGFNLKSKVRIDKSSNNLEIQKAFIKNKMCVCIIFNIFLSSLDKDYLILKDVSSILSKGDYGYYVLRDNPKNLVSSFTKYIKENVEDIFPSNLADD